MPSGHSGADSTAGNIRNMRILPAVFVYDYQPYIQFLIHHGQDASGFSRYFQGATGASL